MTANGTSTWLAEQTQIAPHVHGTKIVHFKSGIDNIGHDNTAADSDHVYMTNALPIL